MRIGGRQRRDGSTGGDPNAAFYCLVVLTKRLAQHQHWDVRMRQYVLCFAAHQQTFDALAPM